MHYSSQNLKCQLMASTEKLLNICHTNKSFISVFFCEVDLKHNRFLLEHGT